MPPFNMRVSAKAESCARRLEATGDYRILRRVPNVGEIWCRSMPVEDRNTVTKIAVLDVETTGLDAARDKIIELAIVTMTISNLRGDLLDIAPPVSFLEDPGTPLTDEIVRLTGLSDGDLIGEKFDDDTIITMLANADVIVAHNAGGFDRAFVVQRFPEIGAHPWACSLREVDWLSHGLSGSASVGALLTASGLFSPSAHRAGADAWATAVLLAMPSSDGCTIAAHLCERARKTTCRLYAIGAPFSVKSDLKSAGYRWCATRRSWWRDGDDEQMGNEAAWLTTLHPAIRPELRRIDWVNRHAG